MVRDLEPEIVGDELGHGDTVMLEIRPGGDGPPPRHPYLANTEGSNGAYNYYFVPWSARFPNPLPDGANFRYGKEAKKIWGDRCTVRKALLHDR